jgi:hypothetical protein
VTREGCQAREYAADSEIAMNESCRLVPAGAVALALVIGMTAGARAAVPRVDKVTHPGAEAAPASDPRTYPDEDGFARRAQQVFELHGQRPLASYRRGWFARGGDPAKYVIPIAICRQMQNEHDAEAIRYMSDNRTPNEHYHFACIGWSRYMGLFGHTLSDDTRALLRRKGGGGLMGGKGTDNHETMWRTAAIVYDDVGLDGNIEDGRKWLHGYVKRLYAYGGAEWNSTTYWPWQFNGFLNVYDFSKDPKCRLLAKAALDWHMATLAQRYTCGLTAGPSERGFAAEPLRKGACSCAWVWWGAPMDMTSRGGLMTAVHPATSSWRPNRVITNIAQRELPVLPYEARNTKPNYWSGLDRNWIEPVANVSAETLFVSRDYTLGTLWYGEDLCSQLVRLHAAIRTAPDRVSFLTGGHVGDKNGKPTHYEAQGSIITHAESWPGKSHPVMREVWIQQCQVGSTMACLARFPEHEPRKVTFVTVPQGAKVEQVGKWWIMTAGDVHIGVLPLTDTVERKTLKQRKKPEVEALYFPGNPSGFVLTMADRLQVKDRDDFIAEVRDSVDAGRFAAETRIVFTSLDGRRVEMRYDRRPRSGKALKTCKPKDGEPFDVYAADIHHRPWVRIDGVVQEYDSWPVHDSPYLQQKDGVLRVNDGRDGFVIDFSGTMPVYRPWKPAQ